MSKPTIEQVKEFWELCGLTVAHTKESFATKEHYALITNYGDTVWSGFNLHKSVDLNNLFKYAVPKLKDMGWRYTLDSRFHSTTHKVTLWEDNDEYWIFETGEDKDPALALFWAIWEVLHVSIK